MTWSTPKHWTEGQTVTPADYNFGRPEPTEATTYLDEHGNQIHTITTIPARPA